MPDKFLTASEAANTLRVNVMTIYRYIKAHKLIAYKLGKNFRINVVDFDRFLEKMRSR
jgi:excisionase family DNA binding protein